MFVFSHPPETRIGPPGATRFGQTLPVVSRLARTSFRTRLGLVVLAALVWRVGYVLVTKRHAGVWGDSYAYHYGANILAAGKGFLDPVRYEFSGLHFPSAAHPPLYVVYLAAWSLVGLKTVLWHRLASCVLGAATVGLVGLLGRRLGGDRAGLIAAVLAAAYPNLWLNDAALLSETAAAFAVVLALITVERFRQEPSIGRACQLGAALSLAVLGRAELLILLPAIAIPLALRARGLTTLDRLVARRCGRSGRARADRPVGRIQPRAIREAGTAVERPGRDVAGRLLRRRVLRHEHRLLVVLPRRERCRAGRAATREHAAAVEVRSEERDHGCRGARVLPQVLRGCCRRVAARCHRASRSDLRTSVRTSSNSHWWSRRASGASGMCSGPRRMHVSTAWSKGAGSRRRALALVAFYLYTASAIVGLVAMRRRRQPIWPYVLLAAVATFTAAISFAVQRYRIPFDAVLPALAAVGIDALLRGRSRDEPNGRDAGGQFPQRTAEYDMSFVHLCVAPMMRIVPDFERITRLCVLAPSPQ